MLQVGSITSAALTAGTSGTEDGGRGTPRGERGWESLSSALTVSVPGVPSATEEKRFGHSCWH